MESEKITTRLDIDPTEVRILELKPITSMQGCLFCDNAREVPNGYGNYYPWICEECKEAIAFVKEFRAGIKEGPADKTKEIESSIALL